ncbi:MAG: nuclear transport factor 2 family protein [Parvibaculaceae bacterium]|nr:nuclear transport factor 2 family protein [Parvibaculaceae bacterium]
MTSAVERYADFMGGLSKEALPEIGKHVAKEVFFSDPFNKVVGIDKMQQIFAHMYETLGEVHFEILHSAMSGEVGLLQWHMRATLRGKPWSFEGMTKVEFNEAGLATSHVDYWDAASEFYEYFPVIGWSLKSIRRKISL